MSWYVLNCKPGQEQTIVNSCNRHLSDNALEEAFVFQCERLWKRDGVWRLVDRELFPGYVFLQSHSPRLLSKELEQYRGILRVLEERGNLISVYEEEEYYLGKLCGKKHLLRVSYGFKDKDKGISHITEGPLKDMENHIIKLDWHKRYAQVELPFLRRKAIIWAGVDIVCGVRAGETAVRQFQVDG